MQPLLIHTSIIWTAIDSKWVFAMRKKYFLLMKKKLTIILIKPSYIHFLATEDFKFYISVSTNIYNSETK